MKKPRAWTQKEIREKFLKDMWARLEYCLKEDGMKTPQHKLEVFMHSTLAMLDGAAIDLPGFQLIPNPHPDDKDYHKERGENWFPDNVDIGGALHEEMYKHKPKTLPDRD